jgi:hypothetical protein
MIAGGWEVEPTEIDADSARSYARMLVEAADILEAHERGEYVPPESTYVPPVLTPMQRAMRDKWVTAMSKQLNGVSFMDGAGQS